MVRKDKVEKKFVLRTHFEIVLIRKDKEGLEAVVNYLLENGTDSFQWEWNMLERDEEYRLSIQSCRADNLENIAKLLSDYGQE